MTDKSGHKNKSDQKDLLDQFPADEKERIRQIWDITGNIDQERPDISENDIEHALSNIHERLGNANSRNRFSDFYFQWKWIAAAAVILLIFCTGILFVPKTMTAPYGEFTSVSLPDGSSVELNSGSELRYNRLFSLTNRTVRLDGEAFFSVEERDHPFIVNANGSTVRVTGTEFNVRSWSEDPGDETEVTVSEGSVYFYPDDRQEDSVKVIPGQLSRWSVEMIEPTTPKQVDLDRVLGWRDKKIIFNNKSLLVIFRELERRFNVNIDLENPDVGKEKLTTYYGKAQNIESVLEDICRVKGLRYSETANGYRVYK